MENVEKKIENTEDVTDLKEEIEDVLNGLEDDKEEIEEEKKSFFSKLKDPKYNKWKIIVTLILLICIIGAVYFIYSSFNWSADKIVQNLSEQQSNLEVAVLEDDTDDAISYFKDKTVKVDGLDYTGSIEVFNNKAEALLKKDYYELYDTEMMKVFNEDLLGADLAKQYGAGKWTVYVNGNVLIRLTNHYSDYQVKQTIKLFNTVLEGNHQTEKDVPTESEQKTIKKNYEKQVKNDVDAQKQKLVDNLKEKLEELKKEIETADIDRLLAIKTEASAFKVLSDLATLCLDVETAADNKIKSQATAIDTLLDEAESEYSRDKVDEARTAITALTHTVFDEYKEGWQSRIEQILWLIKQKEIQDYKDQCVEYSYYEIDDSYAGNHAYFYGKVVSISTNSSGRLALIVNVSPQYLFGQVAYWTNSVYVEVDNELIFDHTDGDVIEMWGEIQGTITNEQVFGDDKVYPTFYCKYAS